MPTLILPPRHTPDSQALWKAAIDAGWEAERLMGWRVPEHLTDQEVVLYGEALFAAVVAKPLRIALLEPQFAWLAGLPQDFRRRNVLATTLGNARRLTEPAFVKPADDKSFLAKVYQSGGELPNSDVLSEAIPVLVSEPVAWEVEFRCFVRDRQIRAISPYLRHGELAQDENGQWQASTAETTEARGFVAGLLADSHVDIPPAVVVDVGKISGQGWAVVEANPAWGSGIYGCDPAEVLQVIRRACVRRDAIGVEDEPWIIRRGTKT